MGLRGNHDALGRILIASGFFDPEVCHRVLYYRRAQDAAAYVLEHISRPLDLQTVADAVNMERCAFSRYFGQKVGMTFSTFTRALRIAVAAQRLRESDDTIQELAAACGFATAGTFLRAFKTVTGVTPTHYRHTRVGLLAG